MRSTSARYLLADKSNKMSPWLLVFAFQANKLFKLVNMKLQHGQ